MSGLQAIRRALAAILLVLPLAAHASAPNIPTYVSIDGGAAQAKQTVAAGQSDYALRVPLKLNAENELLVSATNDRGQQAVSMPIKIAQIDLTDVVLARVEARRLAPAEVQELVAQGVIDLQDPENFNVSEFIIVLTIDSIPVQVKVPVVQLKEEPFEPGLPITIGCGSNPQNGIQTTERSITIPCGDGGGGGNVQDSPPLTIIPIIAAPPEVPGLTIPGVIVIDGKIKTLKEFYKVDLILTNVSTLFTLENINATLELPEGKLKAIKPAAGPVMIPNLPPGKEDRGSFIIRGDEIGVHTVTVHYAATLTGNVLPAPIPISGHASTDVEVKGPPKLDVTVVHPDNVVGGEPYDMKVCIKDVDTELPALYTSFELNVGVDAALLDPQTGNPLDGPSIVDLGDILPGQQQCRTYKVLPFKTGPIASCTAGVTQNISLNMDFVGPNGPKCAVGQLPSRRANPDGKPTVIVIPTHRTTDVTINPAVTALFDQPMLGETISTGFKNANFRLLTSTGSVVPTVLQVSEFPGTRSTIAIIRPTSPLLLGSEYTIIIEPTIYGENGLALAAGLVARFTTEGAPQTPDVQAPLANLLVNAPVDPNAIVKGQMIPVTVESSDDVGVDRVNLLLDGEFIDTARPMSPVHFMVESSKLLAGSTHILQAIAIDSSGNQGTSVKSIHIDGDEIPPQVKMAVAATTTRGRVLPVSVSAADNGHVAKVEVFLDGGATPVYRGLTPPYQFAIPTASLPGSHTLRAIATDGAGLTALVDKTFEVTEDTTPPVITVLSPSIGQVVQKGNFLPLLATATDETGVKEIRVFVDGEGSPRGVNRGVNVDTASLDEGGHTARFEADDNAGHTAQVQVAFNVVVNRPDTTPPPAPATAGVGTTPPTDGTTTIDAPPGSVEPNARVEVTNRATGETSVVQAGPDGSFHVTLPAGGNDVIDVVAIDLSGNQSPSTPFTVPAPPALVSIAAVPNPVTLGSGQATVQLAVVGTYSDATTAPITNGISYAAGDPTVCTPTAGGLLQAGKNGNTIVTVTVGSVSTSVPVTVAFPTVVGIEVTPVSLALFDSGGQQTGQLAVNAVLSNGDRVAFAGSVAFGSQNELVASANGAGLVTGRSGGSTTVTVVAAGFPPVVVPVAVTGRTLTGIAVSPPSTTFIGAAQTQALTVAGVFNDNSTTDLSNLATCVSQNPAVATVAGLTVTSAGNGDATVECTVVGLPPATAAVRVKSYQSIAVSPNPVTLIGAGKQQLLTVTATFTDASQATLGAGVTFTSNNAPVATVGASTGLVTSVSVGSATVTAKFGALQGTTTVNVTPRVIDGLSVTPPSLLLTAAGQTAGLSVLAHFNDGTTGATVDPVGYQSGTPAVATVSTGGVVTGVANGSATITVTSGAFNQTVAVEVDIPVTNPPPAIGRIDRPRAAEGDTFVIDGSNFAPLPAGNVVTVGGIPATVLGARKDQLIVVVPAGAASAAGVSNAIVELSVNGQPANSSAIGIYQRTAQSVPVTGGVSQNASAGAAIALPAVPSLDVRAGDRVLLSSAPDILAPLAITGGTLAVEVDGGAFTPVTLGDPAAELTSLFTAGSHTVAFRITASGGQVTTGAIHLIAGPDATGAIAGSHSVVSLAQSRLLPVTFTNLTDLGNVPLLDGSQVVVSILGNCNFRDRAGFCVNSDGGAIANGAPTPEFGNVSHTRLFTVTGGRIDVLYDPSGTEVAVSNGKLARVQVLPAAANGTRTSNQSLAIRDVVLGTIDTAAAPRSQSVALADGSANLLTVTVDDIRDSTGALVPDGAVVVVSTLGNCNHRDRNGFCLNSAGGGIVGGVPSDFGDVAHTRAFTVTNGQFSFQYDPSSILVPVGTEQTTVIQLLPGRPDGSRIGNAVFEQIPIRLTSPFAQQTNVSVQPASVLADNGDRRTTITVTNITDGNGVPVPNGAKVVVSTLSNCNHRDVNGFCINSAGGVIVGGTPSPDFGDVSHSRVLTVQNGQLTIVYSSQGIALGTRESGTAVVQLLPATPAGSRIGNRVFVLANVTVAGYDQASVATTPTAVTAAGNAQIVQITVSGMLDAAGAPIPDGSKVVVSTLGNCNFRDRNGFCINSAGGGLVNGVTGPDFGNVAHTHVFTVQNGSVTIQYDPSAVPVEVGTTATAVITITGARPDGSRLGINSFATASVLLTPPTTSAMDVSLSAPTVLADGGDNEVTITVDHITDLQGQPTPDGVKVVASTLSNCNFRDPNGFCVNSAGGTIVGGEVSGDFGDVAHTRVFTIQNGKVQITYRPNPVALGSPFTDTARITFTPATPSNFRIGIRSFIVVDVGLTSPASGDIAGAGSVTANGTATYVVSNLLDTSGVPLPDGTVLLASTLGSCNFRDVNGFCVNSTGGAINGGAPSANYGAVTHTRAFTVTGGQISVPLQVPASGPVVLQILPATPGASLIGSRSFVLKSIAVTP